MPRETEPILPILMARSALSDVGFRFSIAYNTGNTARQSVAQIWQQSCFADQPEVRH